MHRCAALRSAVMHEEHSEKVDDAKPERSGQADAAKDGAAEEEAKEAGVAPPRPER